MACIGVLLFKADALSMEAVFTTFLGFRGLQDRCAGVAINYRSLLGKYDFGKNHARIAAFSTRFDEGAKR